MVLENKLGVCENREYITFCLIVILEMEFAEQFPKNHKTRSFQFQIMPNLFAQSVAENKSVSSMISGLTGSSKGLSIPVKLEMKPFLAFFSYKTLWISFFCNFEETFT